MSAEVAQRNPQRDLFDEIRAPRFRQEIALALDERISTPYFLRRAITAMMEKPELVNADRASLILAVIRTAEDGLLPNGEEASLVVFGRKVVYLRMIGGQLKRLAEFGWQMRMNVVYENDEFEYSAEPRTLRHIQTRPGRERGKLVAAYAIAEHEQWGIRQLVFTEEDIAPRRAKAQTQQVWNEWEPEMWMKTVGHALAEDIPKPERDRQARSATIADNVAVPAQAGADGHGGDEGAGNPSPLPELPAPDPVEEAEALDAGRIEIPTGPLAGLTIAEAALQHPDQFDEWAEWAMGQDEYGPDGEWSIAGAALQAYVLVHEERSS